MALPLPVLFGLIAAAVTALGLMCVAFRAAWTARHADLFAIAAGGMLITLAFLHLAPEAFMRTSSAPVWMLTGFLAGLVLHQGARWVTGFEPSRGEQGLALAIVPLAAIGIHSLIDGVVYAISFESSFESGLATSLSLILHEFPEGIVAFMIVRGVGGSVRTSLLLAILVAAVTTPLGAILAGPVLTTLGDAAIGALFALSTGLLVFVATGPLLAPLRHETAIRGGGALGAGVGLALALSFSPLHVHGVDDDGHHHDHDGHDHHAKLPRLGH
ncbi:MAG: ZIP family metal transporter [Pseudomonadota bacterium]